MANLVAKFKLEKQKEINAVFKIQKVVPADGIEEQLQAEIDRATAKEEELQENINSVSIALDFETQARETADTSINSAIAIEIANRINADNNLQAQIDTKQPIGDYATNSRVDSVVQDVLLNTNQINVAFETIASDKEELQSAIDGVATDIETVDTKVDVNTQNITNLNNNLEALTGDVENIAGELDSKADKSEIPTKTSELENDSEFTTESEVAQMIASIPRFEVRVVQQLPQTGEAMVLYLVPKDGEAPDVYLEYIWIATTQSFELIGSTTVDLSDYVKNTDYATSTTAGVFKTNGSFATVVNSNGQLTSQTKTLDQYNTLSNGAFISKGTLENIKENLVTSVGDTKYQSKGDYATNTALTNGLATKQNTISDLSTIRSNANNSLQYGSISKNSVTTNGIYLATHPELTVSGVIIPFINNDIAFFNKKGGTLTYKRRTEDGEFEEYTQSAADRVANGRPDYVQINPLNHYEWEITLELDKLYMYGNVFYIDFGQTRWGATYIKIEYKRKDEDWIVNSETTNNTEKAIYKSISGSSNGLEALRLTLRPNDRSSGSSFRIAQIGLVNYNGKGSQATMLGLDGGTLYGDVNFASGKLVDYVKNTDYATSGTGGVVKVLSNYALGISDSGNLYARTITSSQYATTSDLAFISKATLENIKESLVTSVGDTKYQPTITKASNNQNGIIQHPDGRMEQWGLATSSNTGETEFTMNNSFIDTNFQVFIEPRQAGDLVHYAIPSATNKFKARIQNTNGSFMTCQFQWRAYGFWK